MIVYHGSKEKFEKFDFSKVGLNGTSEGKGIYFTDNIKIAKSYGDKGFIYTVKFNGKKTLSNDGLTISRNKFKEYLIALDEETEYLSNWGDKSYSGLHNVVEDALCGEYDNEDNDVDLIAGVANACGDLETTLRLLYEMFGYDSIVLEAEWGKQTLYIALTNDIIEIVSVEELN